MPKNAIELLEKRVRNEVESLLAAGAGAREISARIFSPGGLLAKLANDRAARATFTASGTAGWVKAQLADLRTREIREFEREVETLSGRMTLIVPKSLHAALKREAASEGVSLAELLRLKVSVPYRELAFTTLGRSGRSDVAEGHEEFLFRDSPGDDSPAKAAVPVKSAPR